MINIINAILILLLNIIFVNEIHAKKLEEVSLQLKWMHQFQFAGYYMAKEKGFYEDAGLDVRMLEFQKNINLVDKVVSGDANYAIGSSSLIVAASKGKKITALAAILQSSPLVFASKKISGIEKIEDFKNKKIMLSETKFSVPLEVLLKFKRLNKKNMQVQEYSFDTEDFVENRVDIIPIYTTDKPYMLGELGIELNIFDPKNYGLDFYSNILFTSHVELKNHKGRTLRFKQASLKGWEYAFSNIEETVELIFNKYNTQNKTKNELRYEANELKKLAFYNTDEIGHIDINKMKRIYDIYNFGGFIDSQVDIYKFVEHNDAFIEFTKEEKMWLASNPIMTYSEVDWRPLSIIDNAKMTGIMGDYLDLVSSRTGIVFKFVPSKSWPDVLEKFKQKKIDLVPGIGSSSQENELGLVSDAYKRYPMVIVTGDEYNFVGSLNDFDGKTIAVPKHYTSYNYLVEKYPNIKLKTTKNIQDALMLVSRGEADAFVGHLATSSYYMDELDLVDLKVAGLSDFEFEHRYLIDEENPLLLSIINKVFSSISKQEQSDIHSKWIINKNKYAADYTLIRKIVVLFTILLVIGAYFYLKLRASSLKLERSDYHLRQTQRIAHIGVWEFDTNNDTRYWSDEVYNICGLDKNEYMPTLENYLTHIHPRDRELVKTELANSIENKTEYRLLYRIVRPDGTLRFVDARATHEYDEYGKHLKSVGITLDVTAQRKLELKLTSLNKTLDQRVQIEVEKNAIQQQTLFDQSRLAQMGEMISMIAHQWRQPLSAISAISSVLVVKAKLKTLDDEYVIEKAEDISNSTQYLSSTIDDFRNFFKTDKEKEVVDFCDLIDSVLSIVKISIDNKKIDLMCELTCKEKFETYANELKQVILSLIKNSEDVLIDKKVINPHIKIKSYSKYGKHIFEITDNGGGVPSEIVAKIFDPYFSTKTKKDGTGLGLYMSKLIVEDHCGGKLTVSNGKDGAIFKIIL